MTPRDTPARVWRDPAPLPTRLLAPDLEGPRAIMKMQDPRKAESSSCATKLSRSPQKSPELWKSRASALL